ncbi:MAG: P-type DNA transfer ATPase VirB11 [Inquilinus sp.]|uniref:P-type DNA transfer ATPase VirB11 n=1 Tax=Inquilinus sp. TaxID=1932117 RepID=UPI003F383917
MIRPGENTLRLLLAPIAANLADPAVTEIVINRPGEAGVETREGWSWLDLPELTFSRLDAIATLCAAMSQQDVGPERPLCGSVLPDGQRVQICRPPAVAAGTISLTIRRPSSFAPTISTLAAGGLFSRTEGASSRAHPLDRELMELHAAGRWEEFFPLAVRAKKTIIAAGDTGSGKTTFAKALIQAVPLDERLVTIEDTAEFIGLPQRNLVSLFYSKGDQGLARVRSEDLIEAALRMRPDRVLMQELRDGAAFTFIRGSAAGHPGSITTCHAGSAAGAFDALRLMVKQHDAGKHLADADVRVLLRQLVDVVVHCRRDHRGFAIEEVYFDPAAKNPGLVAPLVETGGSFRETAVA